MSVKIYEAYRFPAERINDYIDWAREQMIKTVEKQIEYLMANIVMKDLGECPEHLDTKEGKPLWLRNKQLEAVMERVHEAAESKMRDPFFDIECGFNLWFHEGNAYVIPIAENYILKSIRDFPDWVEEYCYFNNSDEPEDVTEEEWEERRKNWEAVCIDDHNGRRLYHEVVKAQGEFDTFELRHRIATGALWRHVDKLRIEHQKKKKKSKK